MGDNRLREQLMHFVTQKESPEQKPESVKSSVEQSDSLYQMLQEYMAENQQLKNENDKLKTEVTQFRENLSKEKENNDKITKEVVKFLQPNQQNYPVMYQPMPPPAMPYYPYAYPPPPSHPYHDYQQPVRQVESAVA